MTARRMRRGVAVLVAMLVAGTIGAPGIAQEKPPAPDYSKGPGHFPNLFGPYRPVRVEAPNLINSPRVGQLIRDGKLQISLQDVIALALDNNLDISVQRYVPWLSATDVLDAKAGHPFLRFDPQVTSTLGWDRRSIPINNPFLAGTGVALTALTNYNTTANFQLSQGFHTGTAYSVTFNNNRQSTTSPAQFLNPSVQSSLFLGFQQPLLNGFGLLPNTRFIRVAKNSKRIADLTFANQIINTVSQVQNMYWDLVFAREDVRVKERSVQLAEKLYRDNKRQVEIGTLAPIEVVRAEAEVARTRQDLIVAQTFLLQQQMLMKNALSKNPLDPALLEVEIIPTDVIAKPAQPVQILPIQDAVKEAWEKRPDIRQSQIDLESREITRKATRNALLPLVTLSGQFGGIGLAGNSRRTTTTPIPNTFLSTGLPVVDTNGMPLMIGTTPAFSSLQATTTSTTLTPAGLGDALARMRNFDFPSYGVALNVTIPIRNRAAQADSARALLEERQAETRYRQLQNAIVVEVRNAQIALEQNSARVDAAQKSRELAERTLDAEQKKYQLGASTIFFVIQAQRDLAQAQSVEVRALADLLKAEVEFDRALGRTLEVNKIDVAEAKTGQVYRDPRIPGTPTSEWPAPEIPGPVAARLRY